MKSEVKAKYTSDLQTLENMYNRSNRTTTSSSSSSSSSGCYIATMIYGDYNHPQVLVLRKFRDDTLAQYSLGRAFIKFYYKHSPRWVTKLEDKKAINRIIKKALNQVINLIKTK